MKIAADFTKKEVVYVNKLEWVASPMAGVDRKFLDRVGGEVARASSIVRYAPGSQFSPHVHTGGEEFIVLDGVFQDEHGDYPIGSYVRNPPQSSHAPSSEKGCTIFVKLWQFQPTDRTHVNTQMNLSNGSTEIKNKGVYSQSLYKDAYEDVSLLVFEPNSSFTLCPQGGAELLVIDGELIEDKQKLIKHSWLRSPCHSSLTLHTAGQTAKVWLKTGHLANVQAQIERVQSQ